MVTPTRIIRTSILLSATLLPHATDAFTSSSSSSSLFQLTRQSDHQNQNQHCLQLQLHAQNAKDESLLQAASKFLCTAVISAALLLSAPAFAEDELMAKYGGKGFDSSLVDQTCLVNKCSLQAKACLADDPSCRKGLTCTAKCLGDNACITGCMARYGNKNLDNLLKCTIEDNACIKIAILDGGADKFGEEPRAPAPTVKNFAINSMEGSWYKVVGFNPNYDCYACQRNTFTAPVSNNIFAVNDKLLMNVEFSMPHLLPDGSPLPPKNSRETVRQEDGLMLGSQSIAMNDYETHETMVFDTPNEPFSRAANLVLSKGTEKEAVYSRTAHSEGEMFGLSKCFFPILTTVEDLAYQCHYVLTKYRTFVPLQQNSGKTGTFSVKTTLTNPNSSLCTTMAKLVKTLIPVPSCTAAVVSCP